MKTPGPQNPGVYRRLENVRRSRYFFLAAFFLAAGFLAAFFLAAILVYLLHSISDPMNGFGDGPKCIPRKVCRLISWSLL
jgi:predicted PurR-regulated permease PerM